MRTALLMVALTPTVTVAQGFDIWLFDRGDAHRLVARVTDREGYDNQPAFTEDGQVLLFSSDRVGGTTDVFAYRIRDGSITNVTATANENEYSPQPWRNEVMYVLQEGVPYQHVWVTSLAGGERTRVLTSYIPVGYYARNETGVLFWGRYAAMLFFEPTGAEIGYGNGESLFVLADVGRSLHAIPGTDDFSFVHKQRDSNMVIKRFSPGNGAITPIARIPSTNEDYCWTPEGILNTVDGATLLAFRPGEDESWQTVASLETVGFGAGSRCAVSPDGQYFAVVATRR